LVAIVAVNAVQRPIHPVLGIAMDLSIQPKSSTGAICTLSLSFNNDGPLGTFFRYISDTGTYVARYDDLLDGKNNAIDVSQVLACYQTLHQLEQQLNACP
jgi:2-hydroxy-4-carboxymuconate semialdehyde hemiacetal dehydrogenase